MALVRASALKDSSVTILSSGANGTVYDLSTIVTAGQVMYAGLHVTTQSTDSFQAFIQSASSSGFSASTTEFQFTARTSRGAELVFGTWTVTVTSTDRKYWRTRWTLSTGSNAPSVRFIDWVAFR